MLPIPIMSTEILVSCAEIGDTEAARTCAEHITHFITRQTGRFESLNVRLLVDSVVAPLQRHLKWASLRSRMISPRLPMMVIARTRLELRAQARKKKVRLVPRSGGLATTLATVSQCWNLHDRRQMSARRRPPRLAFLRPARTRKS